MADFKNNKPLRIFRNILVVLLVYALLIHLLKTFEGDSAQSALTTYQNVIWYSLVTLTTVGYGDLFPITLYGRAIGYVFIIASLGIYGILIGQFTTLMSTIKENRRLGHSGTNFIGHAVIIGWNDFSRLVMDQLIGVGKKITIVTDQRKDIDTIRERYDREDVFTLYADFNNYEMLSKANIEDASIIFVNNGNDTAKLVYILNIRKKYPNADFVVTLDNPDLKDTFLSAGVSNTISSIEISSKLLASYMFEPDVASFSESIMSYAEHDTDYDIKQFLVTDINPYVGQTYQDAFFDLKKRFNTILVGITKRDKFGHKKLVKNPLGELKIAKGDYLLVILNGKAFQLISKVFKVAEGYIKK